MTFFLVHLRLVCGYPEIRNYVNQLLPDCRAEGRTVGWAGDPGDPINVGGAVLSERQADGGFSGIFYALFHF